MKFKFLSILLASMVISLFVSVSVSAIDVFIDGEKVQYNDALGYPVIENGRTLVPLRATMEAYGANVSWDAEQQVASVILDEVTVNCRIGESCIYRNGTRIPNEVGAKIVGGRTYLPIRVVLEAFDATVGYDGNVLVSKPEAQRIAKIIESAPAGDSNFWNTWINAVALKDAGRYSEAIEAFKPLVPTVLAYDPDKNITCAMAYNHLGYCYNMLGMFDYAVTCFNREADYWDLVGDASARESAIAARRKAKFSKNVIQFFATTDNPQYNVRLVGSKSFLPSSGTLLGVTLKLSSYKYLSQFSQFIGKNFGGGLIYGTFNDQISRYKQVFNGAALEGTIVQYAIQPADLDELSSIVANDSRIIKIAQDLQATGAKVLVRFACEMNEPTSDLFTENYELYKEKFRIFADILHAYAPNCAVVWSPNFSPESTMELYYPGDNYVDFVGISAYSEFQPETDPLEVGVDRSRSADILNKLVSLYGYKKPIIVSECGASYRHAATGNDITEFASKQLNEFFTYLPIKFPQVAAAFLFETYDINGVRLFEMTNNTVYKNAFANAIMSNNFISSAEYGSNKYSFELGTNVRVPAAPVQLHSFVKTLMNDFSYVVYRVNGTDVGAAYGIPYTIDFDFSPYKGQTVALSCLAFDSQQKLCASKTINIIVE